MICRVCKKASKTKWCDDCIKKAVSHMTPSKFEHKKTRPLDSIDFMQNDGDLQDELDYRGSMLEEIEKKK